MIKHHIESFHPIFDKLCLKIFKRKFKLETYKQFVKHYFVGGISAVLNYCIFNIFKYHNFSTTKANLITFIFVLLVSFILQKFFTYKPNNHSLSQPILFFINSVLYFILDTLILLLMIDKLGIIPLVSKFVSVMFLAPSSFLFQKFVVFREKI